MISAALAVLETDEQRNELSKLYDCNIKTFYSIAFSKLHNEEDAKDAIQDAFLAVAKNPDLLFKIPDSKRVSYINVIIRNSAYKIWGKRNAEREIEADSEELGTEPSAEEIVLDKCSCEEIIGFIDTLPEKTKTALYLKSALGLTNADLARILGISEEAAKKRVLRAIYKIREYAEVKNYE